MEVLKSNLSNQVDSQSAVVKTQEQCHFIRMIKTSIASYEKFKNKNNYSNKDKGRRRAENLDNCCHEYLKRPNDQNFYHELIKLINTHIKGDDYTFGSSLYNMFTKKTHQSLRMILEKTVEEYNKGFDHTNNKEDATTKSSLSRS